WQILHYVSSISILILGCYLFYRSIDFYSTFFVISAYIFILNILRLNHVLIQKTQIFPAKKNFVISIIGIIIFSLMISFTFYLKKIYTPTPSHVIGGIPVGLSMIFFGTIIAGSAFVINSDQIKWWALNYRQSIKGPHRLSIEDVFSNSNRLTIIELLSTSPGIHFNELQRHCQIGRGQLKWHLDILEQYGIIHHQKIKQYTAYFLKLKENSFDKTIFKKLSKTAQNIEDIIKTHPGITASEISRQLKLHRSSVKYHVDKMRLEQQVRIKKIGRKHKLFID
ncbi:MAG: hypothetical protein ACTSXY_01325, partial [Promethearchaeota archaeon]